MSKKKQAEPSMLILGKEEANGGEQRKSRNIGSKSLVVTGSQKSKDQSFSAVQVSATKLRADSKLKDTSGQYKVFIENGG
jgi:hypothetical protein